MWYAWGMNVVQCVYECRHGCGGGGRFCSAHMQRLRCRLGLMGHLGPTTMEAWWVGSDALSGPSHIVTKDMKII